MDTFFDSFHSLLNPFECPFFKILIFSLYNLGLISQLLINFLILIPKLLNLRIQLFIQKFQLLHPVLLTFIEMFTVLEFPLQIIVLLLK